MQQIINQLGALIDEYSGKISDIPEEEFSLKSNPAKWSKKEILGHLIDSAQNNIQRFVRTQYENKPHIVYNQDRWVETQNYRGYSTKDLVQLWQLLNKHICIILANMPEENYSLQCNTGKELEQLYTLEFLAKDYITHHLHHLKQIFNNQNE